MYIIREIMDNLYQFLEIFIWVCIQLDIIHEEEMADNFSDCIRASNFPHIVADVMAFDDFTQWVQGEAEEKWGQAVTLVVGRVSPPTVSRIETANDLYTTVTHIPKEHLSIKYPSGKCLVMQKIDFIISL